MRGLTEDHDTHMNPGDEERIRKQAPTGQQAEPTGSFEQSEAEAKRLEDIAGKYASRTEFGEVIFPQQNWMMFVADAATRSALAGHQSERPAPAGQAVDALAELLAVIEGLPNPSGRSIATTKDAAYNRERRAKAINNARAILASQAERAEGKPAAQEGGHG